MYKLIAIIITIVLSITVSASFAQEFSFQRPSAYTPNAPSSREATLSPDGFAKSSTRAYQEQQAKVAAIAAEKYNAEQMQRAAQAASKPAPGMTQKPAATLEQLPQKPISQPKPSIIASPAPAETTPAPAPAVQPYTGFQSPPPSSGGSYNNGSAPSNNQNSGGWGSSIKY